MPQSPTSLSDEIGIALANLADAAAGSFTPTLRLGVTGLSRAGKTIFITALVHNLLTGGRLPGFAPLADGRFIALALRSDALAEDCSRAALVVTAKPAAPDCQAMAIDRARLQSQGALALSRNGDGFAVRAVRPRGANRPWLPATAGDGDFETNLAPRPAAPRARDATPSEADLQAED